jgi:hypothetical protein
MASVIWERWVASLDASTCLVCLGLHGQLFRQGEGPRPGLHINCRCVRVFHYEEVGETVVGPLVPAPDPIAPAPVEAAPLPPPPVTPSLPPDVPPGGPILPPLIPISGGPWGAVPISPTVAPKEEE